VKNRTLGSVFIVAGTTIGAGMLAMPLAAAGAFCTRQVKNKTQAAPWKGGGKRCCLLYGNP